MFQVAVTLLIVAGVLYLFLRFVFWPKRQPPPGLSASRDPKEINNGQQ